MSIHNIFDKIKGLDHHTRLTIIYVCVLVFIGIAAFGLGRLSVETKGDNEPVKIIDTTALSGMAVQGYDIAASSNTSVSTSSKGAYVASKNGKLYYTVNCSGAKRIKASNQVWFMTESDAQKSGLTRSPSCK